MIESVFVGVAGAVVVCFLLWLSAELYARAIRGLHRRFFAHVMTGFAFYAPFPWWSVFRYRLRTWAHEMVDRL